MLLLRWRLHRRQSQPRAILSPTQGDQDPAWTGSLENRGLVVAVGQRKGITHVRSHSSHRVWSFWSPHESAHEREKEPAETSARPRDSSYNSVVPTRTFHVLPPPPSRCANRGGVNHSSQPGGRENYQERKMGLEIPPTSHPTTNIQPTKGPSPHMKRCDLAS